ncbi:MAG: PD-(D/E)XK nuclease family protein [Uliginosibacterium sp.]|nr:PD-(D/E)XK nuclease family protein [Uliginosibacterium sp.]
MNLVTHHIAPDAEFHRHAARLILGFAQAAGNPADLSAATVVLPNLKLAAPLAQAMGALHAGPLLLPQMLTLSGLAEPWLAPLQALPDSRRQLLLHGLLRSKDWFDEGLLWEVVAELVALFDTLTEAAVALPADEDALLSSLEAAFALHDSSSLAFEAKLVNTLWRAEAQGRPSRTMARLLAGRRAVEALPGPLIVVAEHADTTLIDPLLAQAAARVPTMLLLPDRVQAQGPLAATLLAAWPLEAAPSLHERVSALPSQAASGARERIRFIANDSLEALGQAVADRVLAWLRAGKRNIALIAADRLAARRARALLEREGVLVLDETGWKMSTTRVAAVVDTWLEVLASDAYHRAVVDLLRSPLLFADVPSLQGGAVNLRIEALINTRGLVSGLDRMLAEMEGSDAEAAAVLLRLREARRAMAPQQVGTIADWLRRLEKSLQMLGAGEAFSRDQAGREWFEWLHARIAELSDDEARFSFSSWRAWFNRQMDACLFRDESIDSPVVMTHLAATRLRSFDAAVVIGADAEHLAPPRAAAWLSHAGVRRQLGLPGLEAERQRLQEDLAGLLLASGETVISWQCLRRDEELMPAAELAVLSTALGLACGEGVVEKPVVRGIAASPAVGPVSLPQPRLPPDRVPKRLSASAMQTLLDCPYRYFARYVLRLAEVEELSEAMEKRDFGEQLHAILNRFHQAYPVLSACDTGELLARLESLTDAAFQEVVTRNFQDHAWRLRWRERLAGYIRWQCEREAAGWRWAAGEEPIERDHELSRGHTLRLHGRIDRRDSRGDDAALLDYKSRNLTALRKQAADPDDVQLAFYALLKGTHIAEAAYVALDDDTVALAAIESPESRAAGLHDCITTSFEAMHAGAGLPANGADRACAWCDMRGLCRKEWMT